MSSILRADLLGLVLRRLLHHLLRQHDIAAGRQMRKQVELLKDHPDLLAAAPSAAAPRATAARPPTLIAPELIVSSPLMQRSSVDLPEPLLPMIAITSPGSTSRSMPLSTSFVAEALVDVSDLDERH